MEMQRAVIHGLEEILEEVAVVPRLGPLMKSLSSLLKGNSYLLTAHWVPASCWMLHLIIFQSLASRSSKIQTGGQGERAVLAEEMPEAKRWQKMGGTMPFEVKHHLGKICHH